MLICLAVSCFLCLYGSARDDSITSVVFKISAQNKLYQNWSNMRRVTQSTAYLSAQMNRFQQSRRWESWHSTISYPSEVRSGLNLQTRQTTSLFNLRGFEICKTVRNKITFLHTWINEARYTLDWWASVTVLASVVLRFVFFSSLSASDGHAKQTPLFIYRWTRWSLSSILSIFPSQNHWLQIKESIALMSQ